MKRYFAPLLFVILSSAVNGAFSKDPPVTYQFTLEKNKFFLSQRSHVLVKGFFREMSKVLFIPQRLEDLVFVFLYHLFNLQRLSGFYTPERLVRKLLFYSPDRILVATDLQGNFSLFRTDPAQVLIDIQGTNYLGQNGMAYDSMNKEIWYRGDFCGRCGKGAAGNYDSLQSLLVGLQLLAT